MQSQHSKRHLEKRYAENSIHFTDCYAYTTGTLGPALQTNTYAYGDSNWKDKLTAYNGIPLTYDAMGNLTEFEGINFTWTAGRQLKQYEFNNGISDLVVDYKYNADGLRTQKKVTDNENFYSVTYDYIWADGKLVSRTDGTDVLYFIYDSNNSPIGVILNDSATYLYIKNLQGDVTGIADENGNIIVNYSYDEWGRLLSMTGSGAGTIGLTNPLRYSGYYYDAETGYYYLQSRYYSPYWGRFLNADYYVDTEKDSFGTNMFAYCENNSINYIDPNGFFGKKWHGETTEDIGAHYFNKRFVIKMAAGNKDVDNRYSALTLVSWNQGWHFNVNKNNPSLEDSRDIHTEEMIQNAFDIFMRVNREKKLNSTSSLESLDDAFYYLGMGLHCQQDKIAHNDAVSTKRFGLFWVHTTYADKPETPWPEDPRYSIGQVAEIITEFYMLCICVKINCNCPRLASVVCLSNGRSGKF